MVPASCEQRGGDRLPQAKSDAEFRHCLSLPLAFSQFSDLIGLVLGEGVLAGILVDAASDAEAQDEVVPLAKLMDFHSLLKGGKEERESQKGAKVSVQAQNRPTGTREEETHRLLRG